MLKNIVLVLLSLAVAMVGGEFLLRKLWNPVPGRVDVRQLSGMTLPGDPEIRLFVPGVKAEVTSPTAEFSVKYVINHLGMRDLPRTLRKTPGRPRILFLGDEPTEGWGVERGQTYPAQIELLSQGAYEGLNAGMRDGSPGTYWFRLKSLLDRKLEFDAVVVQLHDDDPDDDAALAKDFKVGVAPNGDGLVREPFYKKRRLYSLQGPFAPRAAHTRLALLLNGLFYPAPALGPLRIPMPNAYAEKAKAYFQSKGVPAEVVAGLDGLAELVPPELSPVTLSPEAAEGLWSILVPGVLAQTPESGATFGVRSGPTPGSTPTGDAKFARSEQFLKAVLQLAKSRNLPVLVVHVPVFPFGDDRAAQSFKAVCEQTGAPFLPLAPVLKPAVAAGKPMFFALDRRLSRQGHAAVAGEIHKTLVPILRNRRG